MNMKKIIMVLISMALVFTMAGAVSAGGTIELDNTTTNSYATKVAIEEGMFGPSIVISFPSTVYLTGNEGEKLSGDWTIGVTNVTFGSDYSNVIVYADSLNMLNLTNNIGDECAYEIQLEDGSVLDYDQPAVFQLKKGEVSTPIYKNYKFVTKEVVTKNFEEELSDTIQFHVTFM